MARLRAATPRDIRTWAPQLAWQFMQPILHERANWIEVEAVVRSEYDSDKETRVPLEGLLQAQTDDQFETVAAGELLDLLRPRLSPQALRLLYKRYVEEYGVEELAKIEGLTAVEVVRQLEKARKLSRDRLRSLGFGTKKSSVDE